MAGAKLIFFLMTIFYTFIGLMTFFSGEVFIALREIALNTRDKSIQNPEKYTGLERLQLFCRILGVLIIIGAWLFFITVLFSKAPTFRY